MKKVNLLSLEMHNFKGVKDRQIQFFNHTEISGENSIGKTTNYEAILWLLFGINQYGNSAADVRPHDEHGNPISDLQIFVSATFDVDGKKITLNKMQEQKFSKNRITGELAFKGNEDSYEINEIPKSKTEYKRYISEKFLNENDFMICSCASSFFKLDTKKRRAKLVNLVDISDMDVIKVYGDYEELADILEDGTLDDVIKRSKNKVKKLNEELAKIPIQIDEVEKSKVDIDLAELELWKNSIDEQLTELNIKESDLSSTLADSNKASDRILELEFEINDLKRKANEDLFNQKKDLQAQIDELNMRIFRLENIIQMNNQSAWQYEEDIKNLTAEKDSLSKKWETVNKEVFDETTTICPTCGRKLEETTIKDLVSDFENKKKLRLANIESYGFKLKRDIENAEDMVFELNEQNKENNNELANLEKELADLKGKYAELPNEIDLSENDEYIKLKAELDEKQEALVKSGNTENSNAELNEKRQNLQMQLEQVNRQLAQSEINDKADNRIEALKSVQREIAQQIATEERTLDLLTRFNTDKMKLIEEKVNKHFKVVKWRLFQKQVNGEYADVCQAIVEGSNYETCLNTGAKLIADVDIMSSFQSINNVSMPIWIDNAETLNSYNIPKVDGQTILLKVSDDKELKVKEREV